MCFLNTNPTKKPRALVWALTDSDLPAPLPSPDARAPVVSPKSCGSYNTITSLSKAGRLGYREPYYGVWDPLLQVLQCLLLNKPLLQQRNTKKPHGTKNNCMPVQLGQILDKRHKKTKNNNKNNNQTKPTATSEELSKHNVGSKTRVLHMPSAVTPPKRLAKHLCHPSGPTSRHTSSLVSYKESALPLLGRWAREHVTCFCSLLQLQEPQ